MAATADLLSLQASCKRDAEGHKDEFLLQMSHYKALLEIFKLKPSKDFQEFAALVQFISQVSPVYPADTQSFPKDIMSILDTHQASLQPSLRRCLVQALIHLRNRGVVQAPAVLPLFFKLLRLQDKQLRATLQAHIISDIRAQNKKRHNQQLNRTIQNFLYSMVQDDHEFVAKRSLAVIIELWRRKVWRDARTVNIVATAALHKSPVIMLASLKFFLGQDVRDDKDSDDDDSNSGEDDAAVRPPSKEEVYRAYHKGTTSSKKKKVKKLRRVMASVKKAGKRGGQSTAESWAAIHLLHDPQTFAEKLMSRMQASAIRFEHRLVLMQVTTRLVGAHKLQLLNLYPFLQRYLQPSQREVTVVLAALVQACHDLVAPETLQPVLRQLVDRFVSDKSRPEVMTIGLKTVREMCLRCPLVMNEDLLQDLVQYRKFRDKQVSSAARSLVTLFRELAPAMLERKDRGRGADMDAGLMEYGKEEVKTRVDGVELLEQDLLQIQAIMIQAAEDGDEGGSDGSDDEGSKELEEHEEEEEGGGEEEEDGGGSGGSDSEEGMDIAAAEDNSEEDDGEEQEEEEEEEEEGEEDGGEAGEEDGAPHGARAAEPHEVLKKDSLGGLKKQLQKARQRKSAADEAGHELEGRVEAGVPLEWGRILTEDDFDRIRHLQRRKMVEDALAKHGLKSASKRKRVEELAEAEVEERLALQRSRAGLRDGRVNPDDLQGSFKRRKDKRERLKSVLEGREGREFGAAAKRKLNKAGGLSNEEKRKKKNLPAAAQLQQAKNRIRSRKQKGHGKKLKGKKRG